MKNIIIGIILVTGFILFSRTFNQNKTEVISERLTEITPTVIIPDYHDIVWNDKSYAYILEREIFPNGISLINNTADKKSADEITRSFSCNAGINGGFYDTENKPLGWMVIRGRELSKSRNSQLLNGYILIKGSNFSIRFSKEDAVDYGLQTGPILFSQGRAQKLVMFRDKPARRMIIGTAGDGVFILAIFNKEADTAGPNLADLPEILSEIGNKENMDITEAINLDGGSASALYTPQGKLSETSPVGSWWCINNK